ncbi:hypothetical protein ACSYAD_34795 [Acaryochloris marina NIES-2412]|uniref:hypothetical protein n=1 Tax=Acaryochloris marina TaxID=155978 RepID=UPI004059D12D
MPHLPLALVPPTKPGSDDPRHLENTTTQFQFRTDRPAEDSDGCVEDKTPEGFR